MQKWMWLHLLVGGLLVWLLFPHLLVNIGSISLNRTMARQVPPTNSAKISFAIASQLNPQLTKAWRGQVQVRALAGYEVPENWFRSSELPASFLLHIGQQLAVLGRTTHAYDWYTLAQETEPTLLPVWLTLGDWYEQRGDFVEAKASFNQAWQLDPEKSVLDYVAFLCRHNESELAIIVLQETLDLVEGSWQQRLWVAELVTLYQEQEQWNILIEFLATAVTQFPDDPTLYTQWGEAVYAQMGDIEQAIPYFEQAIRVAPKRGVGYVTLANYLQDAGRYAQADVQYQQALQLDPDNTAWLMQQAQNAILADQPQDAQMIYATILTIDPAHAEAHYQMALWYMEQKDGQIALSHIEQAIQHNPLPRYWRAKGQMCEELEMISDAITAYEQALALNARDRMAQDALQRLIP